MTMGKRFGLVLLGVAVVAGLAIAAGQGGKKSGVESDVAAAANTPAGETPERPAPTQRAPDTGRGMPAIEKAAQAKKYLFAFFWKDDDGQTAAMKKVFEAALAKVADRADSVAVHVTEPAERKIVDKFQLDRAPMPLVLAMAPNGAITGGFPKKCEEKDLLDAFATPGCERCMKALQDKKLVFVCVQNGKKQANEAALKGVREFKADERFGEATEVVMLDPADAAEVTFLKDLKIDPKTSDAVTAFLVPPGAVIAEFKGATNKDDLATALQKASANPCAGGSCGPGGCGPKN
jgi:hypothetical protein